MDNLPTIEERHFIIGKIARIIFIDRIYKEHNSNIFIRCPEIQDVITLTIYLEAIFDRLGFPIPKHFDTSKVTKEIYTSDFNVIRITVNDKEGYANIIVAFNNTVIWNNRIPLKYSLLTIGDLEILHYDRVSNNHKSFISTNTSIQAGLKNDLNTAFTPCEASYYSIESINRYWSCDYKTYLKEYCNFIYQLTVINYCKNNNITPPEIIKDLDNLTEQIENNNIPNIIYLIKNNNGFNIDIFGSKGLVLSNPMR